MKQLANRARPDFIALCLTATLAACTAGQSRHAVEEPASAEVAGPMASFARMVPGEWRVTAQSGKSMFHTWHWGPGQHSMRRMTDGSGASGEPWRAVEVTYWHPGRKQVRQLGVSPVARGIWDGTIKFEGETAEAEIDLYQISGRRKLILRWAFDGPDKIHETLWEETGQAGRVLLVDLDHVRSQPPATPRPRAVEGEKPSERLKALEPLLGHAWEAKGKWATGDDFHVRSTFEWVPLADAIYARVVVPGKTGEPRHLLDAYVYHHTGTGTLRCLALSDRGGVYEGDVIVIDGGAVQLDLTGYEGDQVVRHVVRFDFEPDGTLRQRDWSVQGDERRLWLDVHHKKVEAKGG